MKARIFNEWGDTSEVIKVGEQLLQSVHKNGARVWAALELELGLKYLPGEEFREEWEKMGRSDKEDFFCLNMVLRGHRDGIYAEGLQKTRRGRLALIEADLKRAIKARDRAAISERLQQMHDLLKLADVPSVESWALALQAELWDLAHTLSEEVRCSQTDRHVLAQWQLNRNLPETVYERWQGWGATARQKVSNVYSLKTVVETKGIDERPAKGHSRGVTLYEDLGRVFVNGKTIEDFNRKTVLRQTLAIFFEVFPDRLSKANLAQSIWGETYDPTQHDARIYTNIQRLRSLVGENSVENWEAGYRWNPEVEFYYYRRNDQEALGGHRVKTLILETLRKRKASQPNNPWLARSELTEVSDASDATVKRILSQLLSEGSIERQGKGPTVKYALNEGKP